MERRGVAFKFLRPERSESRLANEATEAFTQHSSQHFLELRRVLPLILKTLKYGRRDSCGSVLN